MTERESEFRMVNIQITEEDIEKGERRRPEFCPVARAINRHVVQGTRVLVIASMPSFVTFFIHTERKVAPEEIYQTLPAKVGKFAYLFDNGYKVRPFSFRLRLPKRILKERTK